MSEQGKVFGAIYEAVRKVPRGKVATYGQIAAMCGNPRLARAVGYALHKNPEPGVIPCHRIVNKEGRVSSAFAFGGENVQISLLRAEGVEVSDEGCVSLERYRYLPTRKTEDEI